MKTTLPQWALLAIGATLLGPTVLASPNILSVVQHDGDTDRPPAMATGMTFDIDNPTGTTLIADYTVPLFGEGAKAMTDRVHAYAATSETVSLPAYLVGQEYIMMANNNRDNDPFSIDVTIANHSLVYLLVDNRLGDGDNANPPDFTANMEWVARDLWLPVSLNGNQVGNPAFPDTVGLDESADGSINQYYSVYLKVIPAGTFTLEQPDNSGRNMYGVVIAAIPEPSTATLAVVGLGALVFASRRQRRCR